MRSSRSLGPLSLISSTWNRQLFVSLYSYYILTMWITKLINNVFIHNSLYQLMELSYQEKSGWLFLWLTISQCFISNHITKVMCYHRSIVFILQIRWESFYLVWLIRNCEILICSRAFEIGSFDIFFSNIKKLGTKWFLYFFVLLGDLHLWFVDLGIQASILPFIYIKFNRILLNFKLWNYLLNKLSTNI